MIEHYATSIAMLVRRNRPRLKRLVTALPPGLLVAISVVALVLARALWVSASRPAHRQEIAAAFGSAGILYGEPQSDPTGSRLTFIQQSDKGLTLFLWSAAAAVCETVHEEPEEGADFGMRAWPWSPDGARFCYTARKELNICVPGSGVPSGRLPLGAGLKALAWLSPTALVYLGGKNDLHLVRQQGGLWRQTALTNTLIPNPAFEEAQHSPSATVQSPRTNPPVLSSPSVQPSTNPAVVAAGKTKAKSKSRPKPQPQPFLNTLAGALSLTALSTNGVAWAQGHRIWLLDLDAEAPSLLFELPPDTPEGAAITSLSCSPRDGKLLLTCKRAAQAWLLQVTPAVSEATGRFPALSGAADAVWLNGAETGCAYLFPKPDNNTLVLHSAMAAEPRRLFMRGNVEAFTTSADARHIFAVGVLSNEPAPGIWHYDVAADSLAPVIPWTDRPSARARRLVPQRSSLVLASGRKVDYYLYLPADFNRRENKKYPLVIGDTVYGVADRLYQNRPHGPLWAPAIANCGACVVIVNRKSWFGGIEKWDENVMGVYDFLTRDPTIDQSRVFLYGASAETRYLSELVLKKPDLWAGALLLNPTILPDFSALPRTVSAPRLFISVGELERRDEGIKRYQMDALRYGVPVEYVVHPGATHWLQGKTAVRERTQAMVRFIFDQ